MLERKLFQLVTPVDEEAAGDKKCWELNSAENYIHIILDQIHGEPWEGLGTKTTFAVKLTQSYRYANPDASAACIGETVVAR